MRSAGLRFLIVGLLALLMYIPLGLVSDVVQSRADYSEDTIETLSREWGGSQLFSGPQLVIPVSEEVTYDRRREVIDPQTNQSQRDASGNIVYEHFQETVIEPRAPVYLYPDQFDLTIGTTTQERRRGIFVVPVYTASLEAVFDMPVPQINRVLVGAEEPDWAASELRFFLTANRALRGAATLDADGTALSLEPLSAGQGEANGIFAQVGDPREIEQFRLTMGTNGAQDVSAAAVGRTTRLTIDSDWPHPSFFGDFLPDGSEISDDGFSATWTIPHLARTLPQVARENVDVSARRIATMGVRFLRPNDFYQKAYRSARYGILFIALTFLTILLMDRTSARPAHPVQYLMVGLAQSVFVLVMLAYAEQIGFTSAYGLASGATILLLTLFGATALKMGVRTAVLTATLIVLYAVLYLILQSADYALIAGSTLAFLALAGTMYLTRNEDWYGPERPPGERRGWFARKPAPPAPVAPAPEGETNK
ncbi:MAG: cell envelope integrity protein CreD [Paracoccaceae bacterium]